MMARVVRALSGFGLTVLAYIFAGLISSGIAFLLLSVTNDYGLSLLTTMGVLLIATMSLARLLPSPWKAFGNIPFWIVLASLSPVITIVAYLLGLIEIGSALMLGEITPSLVVWVQFATVLTLDLGMLVDT